MSEFREGDTVIVVRHPTAADDPDGYGDRPHSGYKVGTVCTVREVWAEGIIHVTKVGLSNRHFNYMSHCHKCIQHVDNNLFTEEI